MDGTARGSTCSSSGKRPSDCYESVPRQLKADRSTERPRLAIGRSSPLIRSELQRSAIASASIPVAGIIATNSTVSRAGVVNHPSAQELGGLSGRPLFDKSRAAVRILRETLGPTMPIIGVGGVASVDNAKLLREAGADLVQIYTAMVYRGPGFVRELADELRGEQPV